MKICCCHGVYSKRKVDKFLSKYDLRQPMTQSTIETTPTTTGKDPHKYSVTMNGHRHGEPRPGIMGNKHSSRKLISLPPTPTPPGDVPAQHAGIMTRSKAKVVQLDTPEIQRGDVTQGSPAIDLDITAVTLADVNAVCDVASLISEDTVISGTSADDTSTCLSTHEEVDDGVCDSSDDVMSDDETAIPDNPPPWWNRMVEDMSAEISDMTAKLCVIPKPD